jgi:hypothetical protein
MKAKKSLRAKIEPLEGEKTFAVDWDDKPLKEVMEQIEELSNLQYFSRELSDVRITIRTREKVCLAELFARLDDILIEHNFLLIRKAGSFALHRANERMPRNGWEAPFEDAESLRMQSRYLTRCVLLCGDLEDAKRLAANVADSMEVREFTNGRFILEGMVKDLRAFVGEWKEQGQ